MCKRLQLEQRHQLRGFAVVPGDLVEGLSHPLGPCRRLGLDEDHRNPVDQEDNVYPDSLDAICEAELIRNVERVPVDLLEVEQAHVPFPLLLRHENSLQAPQVLPSFQVPSDRRRNPDDALDELLRPAQIDDTRVELLELLDENIVKDRTCLAPPEPESLVEIDVRPA
jgi:hypothetical protein